MGNQGRKGILSFQRTRRAATKSRMNPHGMIAPTEADLKLIRGNLTVRGTYDATNGALNNNTNSKSSNPTHSIEWGNMNKYK